MPTYQRCIVILTSQPTPSGHINMKYICGHHGKHEDPTLITQRFAKKCTH